MSAAVNLLEGEGRGFAGPVFVFCTFPVVLATAPLFVEPVGDEQPIPTRNTRTKKTNLFIEQLMASIIAVYANPKSSSQRSHEPETYSQEICNTRASRDSSAFRPAARDRRNGKVVGGTKRTVDGPGRQAPRRCGSRS